MASSTSFDDLLHDSLKYAVSKLKIPGEKFKELQETAIRNVLVGKDLFIALPTGFGKSAIYEAIPLCCDFLRERQYFNGPALATGKDIKELNWAAPSDCFAKVTQLLKLPTFQYHVLLGLTVSVGGLTESLVKHSAQSLLSFIKTCTSSEDLFRFTENLLKIFSDYQKVDRVSIPVMKMINLLLSSGSFETFVEDPSHRFPMDLLQLVKKEVAKTGDAQKLLTSIDLFCGMIQFVGETRKRSLIQLMVFLCHKYPKVRGTTANRLYETLMVYDDIVDEEKQEEVMTILMETNWQETQAKCRPIRNHICDLLGVPQPVLKNPGKAKKQEDADDQMESYQDLVSRLGY